LLRHQAFTSALVREVAASAISRQCLRNHRLPFKRSRHPKPHAKRTEIIEAPFSNPTVLPHSTGAFPSTYQRTAESVGESGCSGPRARSRRARTDL